jgi:hypothetical protein
LAETYKTKVATAKNVEFVHISCDDDETAMKGFAKDAGFTFPIVPSAKADKVKLLKEMSPKGIPNYKLVDSAGKIIAEGAEAKTQAAELAEKSGNTGADKTP